jgi:hypothetical protein
MSCPPRPATSKSFAEAAGHRPRLWVRAGDPAAAGAPGVAADRYRRGAGSADLQAGRPVVRPHVGRACRHHAAGRAHRRPSAEPRRRGAPCAIAARCCTPGPTVPMPPASRCSWARRSTATAGREADLEILLLALDCLKAAQVGLSVDLADASIVMPCWPAYQSVRRFWPNCMRRWPPRTPTELASLSRGLPATTREGLLALVHNCTATRRCLMRPAWP